MREPLARFWDAAFHADRRGLLLLRGRLRKAIAQYFEERGFVETECGQLQVSPGNEAHLHAFRTERIGTDGAREMLYLHTSPEFAAKKLLAAGETRIFDFARVFRNREQGPLHAPEFTMLEWYRAHEPYGAVIDDCLALLRLTARVSGEALLRHRGGNCDPFAEAERLTLAEGFARFAGIDLLASLTAQGEPQRETLAEAARAAGLRVTPDDGWSDIFSRVLVERIEPHLGLGRACVLYEYPRCEAALAKPCAHDPRVAERFELYVCGVELANGFGELTDPVEQRRRFILEMDEKARVYGERYPLDEDFLAALAQMPPASGVALGFDRLVMLATGAPRIDLVQWTAVPRPR
ncbi:MAG: EF-P lysine aminoacylase GenX [Alphaproteobacteria bacterium]|nr:EF-P lysine aminoacylase GenX [Alphaproteobacteria bacterium]